MKSVISILLLLIVFTTTRSAFSQEKTLEYMYRYNCHRNPTADHLMCAAQLNDNRVIVAGNLGLALLDPNNLPIKGTQESIQQYTGYNIRNVYIKDNYIYANINSTNSKVIPGFDIFKVENNEITHIKSMSESNVFFEKMCIDGKYLYVTAHNKGIRIYDITNRENPVFTGQILDDFTDAYDIVVSGDSAYVADGHGGLKVVDVTDKQNPKLVYSETAEIAIGTSQAIAVDEKNIYLIAGSEGIVVYPKSDFNSRTVIFTPFAEDCCWAGDLLVVNAYSKVLVYEINQDGLPVLVAHENNTRRETEATMRLGAGIGSMNDSILMCANWNYLDFYKIKDATKGMQPDINTSTDRIRFHIDGGTKQIALSNNGYGMLTISNITVKNSEFTTNFAGSTILEHNDTLKIEITYTASNAEANDILLIESNDIDENPLPIQLYGKTEYMDPGEEAVNFTFPYYEKSNGIFNNTELTLSDFRGKVVWFNIFSTSCPACPPVVSDIQTKIIDEFKDNPNVVTFLYSGKENEQLSRLYEYFDWYYLNTGFAYDETAETYKQHYDQLKTGLPWGKAYIIDQDGIVHASSFGYDPDKTIQAIYDLLENETTGMESEKQTPDFGLKAFPNPVSGNVTFEYTISSSGETDISLYDIKGAKIKTILHKSCLPGVYQTTENCLNTLQEGIYFCRIINYSGERSVIEFIKN